MAGESPKRFPMQDGPDIDWVAAREIYELYSALYGTQQSLERLAERGGFGWSEVGMIIVRYKERYKRSVWPQMIC